MFKYLLFCFKYKIISVLPNIAIHSSRVVLPSVVTDATVICTNGKIVEILSGSSCPRGFQYVEMFDAVLMPGLIDVHVHVNEPGRTDWEGIATASKAAIAGGITTIVDMPLNASPVTTTVEALNIKMTSMKSSGLHCNVGFWGGIIPGNTNEIEPLIKAGVLGFKAFLTHSGIDEFPNATIADLEKAMPIIAKHGLPLLVHAELEGTHVPAEQNNPESYREYLASRPTVWENEAIDYLISLASKYKCKTHIVHLSSAEALDAIKLAKTSGVPISVETAPHYIFFNAEAISDGNTLYKCAPPIREAANNEQLRQALNSGLIDFVATDHSPSTPDLKGIETRNFKTAWGGIASLQYLLPATYTAMKLYEPTLMKLAKWLCSAPAKLAGLQATKGMIAVGADADLMAWQPEENYTIQEDTTYHRYPIGPYISQNVYGQVVGTWIAGKRVYDNEKGFLENEGQFIFNKEHL